MCESVGGLKHYSPIDTDVIPVAVDICVCNICARERTSLIQTQKPHTRAVLC